MEEKELMGSLVIDPFSLKEGCGWLLTWRGKRLFVVKDEGKIKIFEVVYEEK